MSGEDNGSDNLRVRFAPSPTGNLHLGSARTALFNWLVARGSGGTMILRLEDTDRKRSSEEFERDIMDSMRWMGLDWDEGPDVGGDHGPYRQSERMDNYREYAGRLLDAGRAYRCYCTPEELKERKNAAVGEGRAWRYDRKCLRLTDQERARCAAEGRPFAVRFRVPEGEVTVNDMLRGEVNVDASEIDDFIILGSDGRGRYHLAVVVDDITMEVTHVIRGDDHLTNAVRHVLLFEALGADPPRFLHHSLLMGLDGAKLSKRHGDTAVSDYREQGYLPQALVNYLALLSWSPGDDREIFTPGELVEEFSVKGVSASKAIFDLDKLNWLNRRHMKVLSDPELTDLVIPFLEKEGSSEVLGLPRDRLEIAVASVREKIETLADAAPPMELFARPAGDISEKALKALEKSPDLKESLDLLISTFERYSSNDMETAERIVAELREEAGGRGWKAKTVLWPFRLAVTGLTVGPDLTYLIMFWGPGGCADRIKATKAAIEKMGETGG